jgi:peptidoglycan/xylan/chitin deacetylase (PgdA/CDA1 family)
MEVCDVFVTENWIRRPNPQEESTMTHDDPFFRRTDSEVAGPPRELVGYGEHPPMGDNTNDILYELPFALEGQRDLAVESMYEYGSRAGIWRLFRIFDNAGIPVTFFAAAVALERNPAVATKLASRGDEPAGHGYRWSNHFEMTRDQEREAIRLAIASIEKTTGTRPVGWYCREMSTNTRELVVEEGGFEYDSDCYNDDLPYWTTILGRSHLVVPYSLVVNDARYIVGTGYANPDDFFLTAKGSLNRLLADGDDLGRMMSIGIHPRVSGNPARSDGLARFIDYAQQLPDVAFMRRIDIAQDFAKQHPAAAALAETSG